eukprot:12362231-Alexandrium_andersonii.AAC.1
MTGLCKAVQGEGAGGGGFQARVGGGRGARAGEAGEGFDGKASQGDEGFVGIVLPAVASEGQSGAGIGSASAVSW